MLLLIDGVFSPKRQGQLRLHGLNASTSKELDTLVGMISERVAPRLERRGRLARDGWLEMSCSDHLNLGLEDKRGVTLQQLLRPFDHVPGSDGAARKVLTSQTIEAWEEGDYGTGQLGRIERIFTACLGCSKHAVT